MNKLLMKTIGIVSSLGSIYLNSAVVNIDCESNLNESFFENGSRSCDSDSASKPSKTASDPATRLVHDTDRLSAGSHLVSPRKFYVHHGIYLGDGKVAHYAGLSASLQAGPIEVTDLAHFGNGSSVWVHQEQCAFSSDEIIIRALSRVGESQYKILSNNCEHFCNWCINGNSYSAQVSEYLHRPLRLVRMFLSSKTGLIA
ncbi:lecithin retinol acyltransferase family protein [Pseudomonas brassicacearum]|uniref:lecithin retinol acyltransferase family protein n=1 Tax=Pseudomonas brassicacearum TaxID=930166 RepID=UPI000F49AFAB|nr:lecithin retinol acyltransferase family protein [Pseudomonas brassicacearum]